MTSLTVSYPVTLLLDGWARLLLDDPLVVSTSRTISEHFTIDANGLVTGEGVPHITVDPTFEGGYISV